MIYKKIIIIIISALTIFGCANTFNNSVNNNESEVLIRKVLNEQVVAWNKGDMKTYMTGYWKSDSLKFIGKSGIKYGYQNTLDNYIKSYPDKATMGILKFDILSVEIITNNVAFVIGKWDLKREKDDIGGAFTLLFKKIDNKWVITCDHSS